MGANDLCKKQYLMITFGDALSNLLHDTLQFLHGRHYSRLDEFQFGRHRVAEFAPDSSESIDVPDGVLRFGELADQIVFANNWVEDLGEVL